MQRLLKIYGIFIAALLVGFLLLVLFLQSNTTAAQLRKLGADRTAFEAVKRRLILNSADPVPDLVAFVKNPRVKTSAKLDALAILRELSLQNPLRNALREFGPLLRDTCSTLRLELLRTIGQSGELSGMKPVVDLLAAASDSALVNACANVLHNGAHGLVVALYQSSQNGDSAKIDSCRRLLDSLSVGRALTMQTLGSYLREKGAADSIPIYQRRLGTIRDWWAVGTWENRNLLGLYVPFGPEQQPFSPRQTFLLSDSTIARWFAVQAPGLIEPIDMQKLFVKQFFTVAYVRTFIHAPSERDALLMIGSDGVLRVWLNGTLVFGVLDWRGFDYDGDVVKLKLRKGANALMIKVPQDIAQWLFYCRLTDPRGNAMPDVRIVLSDSLVNDQTLTRQVADAQNPKAQ